MLWNNRISEHIFVDSDTGFSHKNVVFLYVEKRPANKSQDLKYKFHKTFTIEIGSEKVHDKKTAKAVKKINFVGNLDRTSKKCCVSRADGEELMNR